MKRSTRILMTAVLIHLAVLGWAWAEGAPETTTTIILVRHAEKQAQAGDPPLSSAGQARAEALARMLADAGVIGLSATPYRRTRLTLEPLAERIGLEVEIDPVDLSDPERYAAELAGSLLERFRGGVVVVAGHSNTIPLLLEALGVTGPGNLDEDEYDDLFVVYVATGAPPSVLHLHYGEPTP
jgi:phosphohistidine phosphatase SixA